MPRELTAKEWDRWMARLRYADVVWREAGMTDDSEIVNKAKRFLNYYRGDQADGIAYTGIDRCAGVVENIFFSTANALVSSVYARNPQTDLAATRPEQKENAERHQRLLNHTVSSPRHRIKREVNRILWDAVLLRFGVARHGYTVPEEKTRDGMLLDIYDPARPDFPWVRRQAPWNFRCDPTGETLHPEHASWCAWLDLYPMEVIEKSPAFVRRRDLVPTRRLIDTKFSQERKPELSPDDADLVEVWTVYDKVRREMFRLSPGSAQAISQVRPWPIASWRTLPYNILQFNPTPDDPMGVSFSELIAPLQDDLNRIRTLTLELAKRQRRMIFIQESNLVEGEAEKLDAMSLVEIFRCQDVNSVVREVQVGGNYQELLLLASEIKNAIRGLMGVSEMERGQRINVETAAEANQVGAGAALQRGRNQGPFEDFFLDVIETLGLGIQDTVTEDVLIPIVGIEDVEQLFAKTEGSPFEVVAPEKIQGDFLYHIRPGSTLPFDPDQQARRELALNSALAQPPMAEMVNWANRTVDTLQAFEKDPAKQMNPQMLVQASMVNRGLRIAAGGVPPETAGAGGGGGVDPNVANLLRGGGGPVQ